MVLQIDRFEFLHGPARSRQAGPFQIISIWIDQSALGKHQSRRLPRRGGVSAAIEAFANARHHHLKEISHARTSEGEKVIAPSY